MYINPCSHTVSNAFSKSMRVAPTSSSSRCAVTSDSSLLIACGVLELKPKLIIRDCLMLVAVCYYSVVNYGSVHLTDVRGEAYWPVA